LAAEDPLVDCDPQPLTQVFVNIVLNAADAMAERDVRQLKVSVRPLGPHTLRVRFQDTGPGIRAEHSDRIFDPFFTTKVATGTGLGLAIAHQTVQRHGGRLGSSSAPGGGAIFDVDLPLAKDLEVSS